MSDPIFSTNIIQHPFDPNDRTAWLALRAKISGLLDMNAPIRLGGSDAATTMGLSEFKTAGGLYQQFLGIKPAREVFNQHTYRGHVLEPVVKDSYYKYFDPANPLIEDLLENARGGKIIREYQDIHSVILNKKYDMIYANIDSYVPSQRYKRRRMKEAILEIKSMYRTALEKWEAGIPRAYVIQLQQYLMICEKEFGEIFILADATMPYYFPIEANKEIQEEILDSSSEFCLRVNKARLEIANSSGTEDEIMAIADYYEPPIEERPKYIQYLKEKHKPENIPRPHEADQELLQHALNYSKAKANQAKYDDDIVKAEVHIRSAFNEHKTDRITFPMAKPDGTSYPDITWKQKFNLNYKKFLN